MVHIETIDLVSRGIILPSDRVGMVIAQPYLPSSSLTSVEPFQYTEQAKLQQLTILNQTLSVARAALHGAPKTHFTIFPEYSISGLDGIELVENILCLADWPNGTVVIGGVDGLTQAQYVQLLQKGGTHVDIARNGSGNIGNQWVNCAIIWVKDSNGLLERWIQPKLHPSWEEENIVFQRMFQGRSIYMFKGLLDNGEPYRFGTLVCFDWVATIDRKKTCQWILADLQNQAAQSKLPLTWLFIIQRNKRPSHINFLTEVGAFFNQTEFPNALRNDACLIFANTAGRAIPGRANEFGGSSVVLLDRRGFPPPTCAPTFSNGGPRFRDGSNLLAYYRDVFFRERGACIHSFVQINPSSIPNGPVGRSFAVENAYVCPIFGVLEPRAPATDVSACVKWLNDELDDIPSLSTMYSGVPLVAQVDASHLQNVSSFRILPQQSVDRTIKLASQQLESNKNADDWAVDETEALKHVIHTLDIMGIGFTPSAFGTDGAHATVVMNNQAVDLLAVRGVSHEKCIQHVKEKYAILPNRQALIISRDPDNNSWRKICGNFLEQPNTPLGQERKITDPSSGVLHLGYRKLLDIFQQSTAVAQLQGAINAEFTP